MKASELVERIQEMIEAHGDLDIADESDLDVEVEFFEGDEESGASFVIQ
jgi:hypothetical protein